jgi:hypothetical protein
LNKTILSLNQKHLVIATLNLSHNYYLNEVIPNIEFYPSPRTSAFLKNYRLILKQEGSRLIILQEGKYEKSVWVPKIAIQEINSLVLGIKFNDEMFQNKTNIPFYTSKDQKFFININDVQVTNSEQELKIYPFAGGAFPNTSDLKPSLVSIKYESSSEIKNLPVDKINNYEDFIPGIYTFHFENQEESTFIWSNFDNLYDGYVSFDIQQNAQNIFNYKFNNRAIYWEYILVSNILKDLESCVLVDDNLEMEFNFEENEKDQSQFVFSSLDPIPLKETYPNKLSLEKMGEKLLNLPFPELKNFNIKSIDVKKSVNKYFLTTYVNL